MDINGQNEALALIASLITGQAISVNGRGAPYQGPSLGVGIASTGGHPLYYCRNVVMNNSDIDQRVSFSSVHVVKFDQDITMQTYVYENVVEVSNINNSGQTVFTCGDSQSLTITCETSGVLESIVVSSGLNILLPSTKGNEGSNCFIITNTEKTHAYYFVFITHHNTAGYSFEISDYSSSYSGFYAKIHLASSSELETRSTPLFFNNQLQYVSDVSVADGTKFTVVVRGSNSDAPIGWYYK